MEKETIEIRQVTENKKAYLELLLLADEQESMIDRYLDRGTMYVLCGHGRRKWDPGDQESCRSPGLSSAGVWASHDPFSGRDIQEQIRDP